MGLRINRKPGEVVVIFLPDGREVVVICRAVRGREVRLEFIADRDIPIWREELLEDVEDDEP